MKIARLNKAEKAWRAKKARWIRKYRQSNVIVYAINRIEHAITECHYCGKPITRKNASIDHILPVSRGGMDAPHNIQVIDMRCNDIKGNMTDHEFYALVNFLDTPVMREQKATILARLKLGWRAGILFKVKS